LAVPPDIPLGRGIHRRFGAAGLGAKPQELPLLLPGHRSERLPDHDRREFVHVVLRDQHKEVHVYGDVSQHDPEFLPQIGVLQRRLLLAGSLLLLPDERLQLRSVRLLPVYGKRLLPTFGGLDSPPFFVAARNHSISEPPVQRLRRP
jgi:hypothetical protein